MERPRLALLRVAAVTVEVARVTALLRPLERHPVEVETVTVTRGIVTARVPGRALDHDRRAILAALEARVVPAVVRRTGVARLLPLLDVGVLVTIHLRP